MKASKTFDGSLQGGLDHKQFVTKLTGSYSVTQDRHSENFPDIDLPPSNPRFITDEEWIRSISPAWTNQLISDLQLRWIQLFCNPPKEDVISEREQMFRCAYQVETTIPETLRQYFLKTWQISFQSWQNLIKS